MDKKTFLEELRMSLRVLKDEELQDIIGEYEQHIDMKVKNGLTVEQAIADFGNVRDLTAEILEAYHVRAEYGLSKEWEEAIQNDSVPKETDEEGERESLEEFAETEPILKKTVKFQTILEWFFTVWKNVSQLLSNSFHMLWHGCSWLGSQFLRPLHCLKLKWNMRKQQKSTNMSDMPEAVSMSKPDSMHMKSNQIASEIQKPVFTYANNLVGRTWRGIGNMIIRLWNYFVYAAIWCLRICWNSTVVCSAVFIGGIGLICLFAAGVLGVLLLQGYPLAGLTLVCAGLVLIFLASAALVWTLIWHSVPDSEEIEQEEGQHA